MKAEEIDHSEQLAVSISPIIKCGTIVLDELRTAELNTS